MNKKSYLIDVSKNLNKKTRLRNFLKVAFDLIMIAVAIIALAYVLINNPTVPLPEASLPSLSPIENNTK
jgi:hypothetical protein